MKSSLIQSRIRTGFIRRLDERLRKMRRLAADRNWDDLRNECSHLRQTAVGFGFPQIMQLAARVESVLPESGPLRASSTVSVYKDIESLFLAVDQVLIYESENL